MKLNDTKAIYNDPFSKTSLEGFAKIRKIHSKENVVDDLEFNCIMYDVSVKFADDIELFRRTIVDRI